MANFLNQMDYKTNATLDGIRRSGYKLSHKGLTTLNMGKLVPIRAIPVVPGQTIDIRPTMVARLLSPMLKPTMDDMYLDYSAFLCYDSQVWDNAHAFYTSVKTEDPTNDYTPTTTYTLPKVKAPTGGWQKGTIADYLNLPILSGGASLEVSALPFRHIANIWNNFFRAQSHQKSLIFSKTDTLLNGSNGSDYVNDVQKGGMCPYVNKMHDFVTSHLPKPQKGNPVSISLENAPVFAQSDTNAYKAIYNNSLRFYSDVGVPSKILGTGASTPTNSVYQQSIFQYATTPSGTQDLANRIAPSNLMVDNSATGFDINDLRMSIVKQQILEKMARGGSRVKEYFKTFFGVDVPNLEISIPEFLGGASVNLETQQVVATNAATTSSPLGNIGGISHTSINGEGSFIKSATQHGYIIIFAYIRQDHTYQQVVEKHWTRFLNEDHLLPDRAHLGEQPTFNQEIYYSGTSKDMEIFGYNEVFSQYKTMGNFVTGQARSKAPGTLDMYHYANNFTSTPSLTEIMPEVTNNLDRTIAVPSATADQFILSIYFDIKTYLPIPVNSGVPGLDRI